MPEVLTITPSESIEVRSSSPAALEVEVIYGASGSPPPKHFHPDQDEHFEVLAGRLRVRVDGDERELGLGEEIDIPRRRVHQMWNPALAALAAIGRARGYSAIPR
jgi:quercetin dioxygenase-like cupin family protein